ncbi:hypothetical protein H671_1g3088 [Cricetulus griseus]|nr:hypothetical protein H671_1g3088 [Cricetulus griseus]
MDIDFNQAFISYILSKPPRLQAPERKEDTRMAGLYLSSYIPKAESSNPQLKDELWITPAWDPRNIYRVAPYQPSSQLWTQTNLSSQDFFPEAIKRKLCLQSKRKKHRTDLRLYSFRKWLEL